MTLIRSAGSCPVCGETHAACGAPSAASGVDILKEEVARVPGPLKKYDVNYNGHQTTMKLNDHDAKLLGLTGAKPTPTSTEASSAGMDPNKLVRGDRDEHQVDDPGNTQEPAADDKQGDDKQGGEKQGGEKQAVPQNKARAAQNKSAG